MVASAQADGVRAVAGPAVETAGLVLEDVTVGRRSAPRAAHHGGPAGGPARRRPDGGRRDRVPGGIRRARRGAR